MGDDIQKPSGFQPWRAIDKAAWRERFSVYYRLKSISDNRTKPLPPWTANDVEEFVKSDPIYGPRLRLTRQGAQIAGGGAVVGGLTTAAIVLRNSKSGLGVFPFLELAYKTEQKTLKLFGTVFEKVLFLVNVGLMDIICIATEFRWSCGFASRYS